MNRSITLQGNIQRSETGQYYLSLPDNSLWTLRPTNNNINLSNDINRQVMVKGNMTPENNVIEVKGDSTIIKNVVGQLTSGVRNTILEPI